MYDSRLILWCLDNAQATSSTQHTLETWLCWSLIECQQGHFLDVNPWGEAHDPYHTHNRRGPVAGDWKLVMVYHKGDEVYMQKAYRPANSWVSHNCCLVCRASQHDPELLYTHHGPNAAHRSTKLSSQDFIEHVARVQTFTTIPGWSIDCVQFDWLHIVDLAISPECSASALIELIKEGCFGEGGTPDEKLRKAFVEFCTACKQCGIRSLSSR